MRNDLNDDDTVAELTGVEGGVWQVFTAGSVHVFDLDVGTVIRIPGPTSAPNVNDQVRPIRSIEACRVGERGRWTMHPEESELDLDYYWMVTSTIARISRFVPAASDDQAQRESGAE